MTKPITMDDIRATVRVLKAIARQPSTGELLQLDASAMPGDEGGTFETVEVLSDGEHEFVRVSVADLLDPAGAERRKLEAQIARMRQHERVMEHATDVSEENIRKSVREAAIRLQRHRDNLAVLAGRLAKMDAGESC